MLVEIAAENIPTLYIDVRPLCVAKTCAVHPVFARVVGELWAADPSKCPRGFAANASWGENLRLPDEAGSRGPAAPRTRKPGQSAHAASTQEVFL